MGLCTTKVIAQIVWGFAFNVASGLNDVCCAKAPALLCHAQSVAATNCVTKNRLAG
jgi:hypothetical protein